jgi:hypothetical protein
MSRIRSAVGVLVLSLSAFIVIPVHEVSRAVDPVLHLPVSAVACTGAEGCVAVASGAPPLVGWSRTGRSWIVARATSLTTDGSGIPLAVACSKAKCLLAGSRSGHIELWQAIPATRRVVPLPWHPAGFGVSGVNCAMDGTCQLLTYSYATKGIGYFSETNDTGSHWVLQRSIPDDDGWAWTTAITVMSCPTPTTCLVVGGSGGTTANLGIAVTRNSGKSWYAHVDRSEQQAVSLACVATECFAAEQLPQASPPYRIIATHNLGGTWSSVGAPKSAYTGVAACANEQLCTTGTSAPNGRDWFGAHDPRRFEDRSVLSNSISCGITWCAAGIGADLTTFQVPRN